MTDDICQPELQHHRTLSGPSVLWQPTSQHPAQQGSAAAVLSAHPGVHEHNCPLPQEPTDLRCNATPDCGCQCILLHWLLQGMGTVQATFVGKRIYKSPSLPEVAKQRWLEPSALIMTDGLHSLQLQLPCCSKAFHNQ